MNIISNFTTILSFVSNVYNSHSLNKHFNIDYVNNCLLLLNIVKINLIYVFNELWSINLNLPTGPDGVSAVFLK